jgi:TonB family protein
MRHVMIALTRIVPLLFLLSHSSPKQASAGPPAATVDSLCLSEILISTPQPYDPAQVADALRKADGAREAIRQGAKFEDMAKKYSDGPSAVDGGRLGIFKRGQLAKSIEDKVFAMKVGDVSDVIRTKQGFTILKVAECAPVTRVAGASGAVEVLGDTQGVDFGPYVRCITKKVEANWYRQIPLTAETKTGEVTIECSIATDGKLTNMRLVAGSGDEVLNRAAWEGITRSSPFPPLPSEFTGPLLGLRLHFHYNPDKRSLD